VQDEYSRFHKSREASINMGKTLQDRAMGAMGAIMGAFVGEALGVGPHWYYDLAELRHVLPVLPSVTGGLLPGRAIEIAGWP
jgi:hypothetical protein